MSGSERDRLRNRTTPGRDLATGFRLIDVSAVAAAIRLSCRSNWQQEDSSRVVDARWGTEAPWR